MHQAETASGCFSANRWLAIDDRGVGPTGFPFQIGPTSRRIDSVLDDFSGSLRYRGEMNRDFEVSASFVAEKLQHRLLTGIDAVLHPRNFLLSEPPGRNRDRRSRRWRVWGVEVETTAGGGVGLAAGVGTRVGMGVDTGISPGFSGGTETAVGAGVGVGVGEIAGARAGITVGVGSGAIRTTRTSVGAIVGRGVACLV